MGVPQIIFIAIFAATLFGGWRDTAKNGDPVDFIAAVISVAIEAGLLIWGGFFHS